MYRILATTLLAGAGLLFAHPALAQVTFNPPSPQGTLRYRVGSNFRVLETESTATTTVLVEDGFIVTLDSISPPARSSGPAVAIQSSRATVIINASAGSLNSDGTFSGTQTVVDGDTLAVSMELEGQAPFPAGTYGYSVTVRLTVTPDP